MVMKSLAKHFLTYSSGCFAIASTTYCLLWLIMPGNYVFGVLYGMFLYHLQYPFQYIALVSIVYGLLATSWSLGFGNLHGWQRFISIALVMLLTIVVSSVPGGVLWKIHDMQAGFFPQGTILRNDLLWGASTGLHMGWQIILLSIPFNIIGLIIGYIYTDKMQRRLSRQ